MKKKVNPESLMTTAGYDPALSVGAAKCPIYLTSTYVFPTAEAGEDFFSVAYGLREKEPNEELGLIYGRINHPNLQIAEERLTLWEKGAKECAIFSSGLAAITTTCFEFLKPGSLMLASSPLYGGTDHFLKKVLPAFGVKVIFFNASQSKEEIIEVVEKTGMSDKLGMILIETPANPTNSLFDIREIKSFFSTHRKDVLLAVDNTYMSPLWQNPILHGADIVFHSATKFLSGHSDIIAGACLGSLELINRIKIMRTFLGNMSDPMSCWLLTRSLETLKVRMDTHAKNATIVAKFISKHPLIENVRFLGNLSPEDGTQYQIFKKQCTTGGAMITFDIKGDKLSAFRFLNNLELIKLAVSLGSTGSLIEHPYTMTHADVDEAFKKALGITVCTIRLSVGLENPKDIIADIKQALDNINIYA